MKDRGRKRKENKGEREEKGRNTWMDIERRR